MISPWSLSSKLYYRIPLIDTNYSRKKIIFSQTLQLAEKEKRKRLRRARKSRRLSKIGRAEDIGRMSFFAQRGMAGNGLQETLLRCETINERRPRSRWRPFSARVRSMPHYNPLTINELLMKWNGRRCRPHRPTGAPEMGGSLWFPSENGNVLRPDATAHPPFPPLSLSLFGYHRPSRN